LGSGFAPDDLSFLRTLQRLHGNPREQTTVVYRSRGAIDGSNSIGNTRPRELRMIDV